MCDIVPECWPYESKYPPVSTVEELLVSELRARGVQDLTKDDIEQREAGLFRIHKTCVCEESVKPYLDVQFRPEYYEKNAWYINSTARLFLAAINAKKSEDRESYEPPGFLLTELGEECLDAVAYYLTWRPAWRSP